MNKIIRADSSPESALYYYHGVVGLKLEEVYRFL